MALRREALSNFTIIINRPVTIQVSTLPRIPSKASAADLIGGKAGSVDISTRQNKERTKGKTSRQDRETSHWQQLISVQSALDEFVL